MEVRGLADVVNVFIERQCAIDSYSEASDTGRWLDTGLAVWRSSVLVELSARCRALVPITITSVLTGFIDKPLRSSQCWAALNSLTV